MSATLRDRLAAILGPGNDDTTAYAQADAVLEVLALETQRSGICGAHPGPLAAARGASLCDLQHGHTGMHEGTLFPLGGRTYWPQEPAS